MAAASTTRRTTSKAKAAPVAEPDEVFEDTDEFEDADEDTTEDGDELEDVEDEDEAPAEKPKRKPPVRPKIAFGSPELAAHVTEVTGENYDARAIRMLLRKMAKDGKLDRVVGEDKARYEFTGPKDPTVLAVVKMVKSGEAKELKQAGLQAVKDKAAAKKAAAKAAEADEDDGMEEVDEAPKPRRRAASAKPATPAKATPATTRRRASAAK
jgi:hypothetical protein